MSKLSAPVNTRSEYRITSNGLTKLRKLITKFKWVGERGRQCMTLALGVVGTISGHVGAGLSVKRVILSRAQARVGGYKARDKLRRCCSVAS